MRALKRAFPAIILMAVLGLNPAFANPLPVPLPDPFEAYPMIPIVFPGVPGGPLIPLGGPPELQIDIDVDQLEVAYSFFMERSESGTKGSKSTPTLDSNWSVLKVLYSD